MVIEISHIALPLHTNGFHTAWNNSVCPKWLSLGYILTSITALVGKVISLSVMLFASLWTGVICSFESPNHTQSYLFWTCVSFHCLYINFVHFYWTVVKHWSGSFILLCILLGLLSQQCFIFIYGCPECGISVLPLLLCSLYWQYSFRSSDN